MVVLVSATMGNACSSSSSGTRKEKTVQRRQSKAKTKKGGEDGGKSASFAIVTSILPESHEKGTLLSSNCVHEKGTVLSELVMRSGPEVFGDSGLPAAASQELTLDSRVENPLALLLCNAPKQPSSAKQHAIVGPAINNETTYCAQRSLPTVSLVRPPTLEWLSSTCDADAHLSERTIVVVDTRLALDSTTVPSMFAPTSGRLGWPGAPVASVVSTGFLEPDKSLATDDSTACQDRLPSFGSSDRSWRSSADPSAASCSSHPRVRVTPLHKLEAAMRRGGQTPPFVAGEALRLRRLGVFAMLDPSWRHSCSAEVFRAVYRCCAFLQSAQGDTAAPKHAEALSSLLARLQRSIPSITDGGTLETLPSQVCLPQSSPLPYVVSDDGWTRLTSGDSADVCPPLVVDAFSSEVDEVNAVDQFEYTTLKPMLPTALRIYNAHCALLAHNQRRRADDGVHGMDINFRHIPDEIVPGFFVGSYHAVVERDGAWLRDNCVSAVVSCVGDLFPSSSAVQAGEDDPRQDKHWVCDSTPRQSIGLLSTHQADSEGNDVNLDTTLLTHNGVRFLSFTMRDKSNYAVDAHFTEAVRFLREAFVEQRGRVLVLCGVGVSRAATIAAALLSDVFALSVPLSVQLLRLARPQIRPNDTFLFHLLRCYSPWLLPAETRELFGICKEDAEAYRPVLLGTF